MSADSNSDRQSRRRVCAYHLTTTSALSWFIFVLLRICRRLHWRRGVRCRPSGVNVNKPKHRSHRSPVPAKRRRLTQDCQLPQNSEAHLGWHQVLVKVQLRELLSTLIRTFYNSTISVIYRYCRIAMTVHLPTKFSA